MEHLASRRLAGLLACVVCTVISGARAESDPGMERSPGAALRVAPAAPGQQYVRCGTLGAERVVQVVWAPNNRLLALRMDSGTVRLIAVQGMREIATLASPLGALEAVAFSPNSEALATLAPEMGQLALWSTTDGSLLSTFDGPPHGLINTEAASIAFSPDGSRIATSLHTIVDLQSGATRTLAGQPSHVQLTVNPQNLAAGSSALTLQFVAGGKQLLQITQYGVGHSPPTRRIALTDLASFESRVVYEQYADYLDGFAVSPDAQWFAIAGHAGASFPGMVANRGGLGMYRVEERLPVAQAQAFSGKLLGFAPSGLTLYALVGDALVTLDVGNLSVVSRASLPSGTRVLAVSPKDVGEVVTTDGISTVWRDPVTLAVRRTLGGVLESITWSRLFSSLAAGIDQDGTVRVYSEADQKELGRFSVPVITQTPPLASLGGSATADGTLVVERTFLLHGFATDWYHQRIVDTARAATLRVFGPYSSVVISADGTKAYTQDRRASAIAVWCR